MIPARRIVTFRRAEFGRSAAGDLVMFLSDPQGSTEPGTSYEVILTEAGWGAITRYLLTRWEQWAREVAHQLDTDPDQRRRGFGSARSKP